MEFVRELLSVPDTPTLLLVGVVLLACLVLAGPWGIRSSYHSTRGRR